LIKTVLSAGVITQRMHAFHAMHVDPDELKAEGERMVGDDIAEEGIKYLQAINFKNRTVGEVLIAAEWPYCHQPSDALSRSAEASSRCRMIVVR
jgi:hypothetical protein